MSDYLMKEQGQLVSGIHLSKGIDPQKDQSYFLARLTQQPLAKGVSNWENLKRAM